MLLFWCCDDWLEWILGSCSKVGGVNGLYPYRTMDCASMMTDGIKVCEQGGVKKHSGGKTSMRKEAARRSRQRNGANCMIIQASTLSPSS